MTEHSRHVNQVRIILSLDVADATQATGWQISWRPPSTDAWELHAATADSRKAFTTLEALIEIRDSVELLFQMIPVPLPFE